MSEDTHTQDYAAFDRAMGAVSAQALKARAAQARARSRGDTAASLTAGETLERLTGELEVMEAGYTGWSRYVLVPLGRIHLATDGHRCGTLREATRLVPLPDLSGCPFTDAVQAHGALLCSICFPGAPVAWTAGELPRCPGGPVSEQSSRYGRCPGCGGFSRVTQGLVRPHFSTLGPPE